jgi:hypothetical protein
LLLKVTAIICRSPTHSWRDLCPSLDKHIILVKMAQQVESVLVSDIHLGPVTNFSFSLKFSLDSCGCYFIAPSLTFCSRKFKSRWVHEIISWSECWHSRMRRLFRTV